MKQVILIASLILIWHSAFSQILLLPAAKDAIIQADSKNNVQTELTFKLLDRKPGKRVKILCRDFDDGDASLGKDYRYMDSSELSKEISDGDSSTFKIHVEIKSSETQIKEKYFNLNITYFRDSFPITEKLKITIDYSKAQKNSDVDTSKWFVSVVTGSNLDFFNAPVFKNFAGEFKVWVPDLATVKGFKKGNFWHVGLDFGIFNYQYFDSDSSNGNIQMQNYLLDPTRQPVVDSSKYVRSIYALNSNVSYNNWGLYINPIFRLSHNDWYNLFTSAHFEFIWRKRITKNTVTNLRSDTITLSSRDTSNHIVLGSFQGLRPLYSENNYFDVYFGIGLPLTIDVKKLATLFLNPTVGLTNFSAIKMNTDYANGIRTVSFETTNSFVPFFLTKFQVKTTVAPVDLVLGGEMRFIAKKQLDRNAAFRAFYLGALIALDKIKK